MQITLTDDQYRRLRRRSQTTGSPISEIVRRAIEADDAGAGARERALASVIPSRLTREQKLEASRNSAGVLSEEEGEAMYQRWRQMRGHDLLDAE
jgi:Ribbon-helix-helix domain